MSPEPRTLRPLPGEERRNSDRVSTRQPVLVSRDGQMLGRYRTDDVGPSGMFIPWKIRRPVVSPAEPVRFAPGEELEIIAAVDDGAGESRYLALRARVVHVNERGMGIRLLSPDRDSEAWAATVAERVRRAEGTDARNAPLPARDGPGRPIPLNSRMPPVTDIDVRRAAADLEDRAQPTAAEPSTASPGESPGLRRESGEPGPGGRRGMLFPLALALAFAGGGWYLWQASHESEFPPVTGGDRGAGSATFQRIEAPPLDSRVTHVNLDPRGDEAGPEAPRGAPGAPGPRPRPTATATAPSAIPVPEPGPAESPAPATAEAEPPADAPPTGPAARGKPKAEPPVPATGAGMDAIAATGSPNAGDRREPAAPVTPDAATDTGTTWEINLASLGNRAIAEEYTRRAQALSIPVVLRSAVVNGRNYWRVRVPGFKSYREARSYARGVEERMGLAETYIAKIEH